MTVPGFEEPLLEVLDRHGRRESGEPASPASPRAAGDVMGWLEKLYRLGLDGVFADDPGMARAVRERVF